MNLNTLKETKNAWIAIIVIIILIAVALNFSKERNEISQKDIIQNIAYAPTENNDVTYGSKSERLYKKAIDNALTKRIEGDISGIRFELYVPKGYWASSTREQIGGVGVRDAMVIYRNLPNGSGEFYKDIFMYVYALPYTNRQALIDSETKRHTYQMGEPGYRSSSYEFVGYDELYNPESQNFTADQMIAKTDLGGEGGFSADGYYLYNIPRHGPPDQVLVLTAGVDDDFNGPAITSERTTMFFDVVRELVIY